MRYMISCLAGIAVSLSLFLMMTYLIDKHDAQVTPPSPTDTYVYVPFDEPELITENPSEVKPPPPINQQPNFETPIIPVAPMKPVDMPAPPTRVRVGIGDIPGTRPAPPVLEDISPPDLTVLVGSKVKYPEAAERRSLEGFVIVENVVDKYGKVVDVRVIESSHSLFEKAAREAVFKWKYSNSELTKRVDRKRIAFRL